MAHFQEGDCIFASLMTAFVEFRTTLYMRGTPGMGPVPSILRGAKYIIKYSLLANFQKATSNFADFMPIFVKFWTPLYMRGTPGMGSVPINLRGAKVFAKHGLFADFREGISNFADFI